MLQLQTVFPDTLELLKGLSSRPEMSGLRLVGGTALALQYGHRQSIDLDFFGTLAVEQDDIIEMFSSMGSFTIHNRTKRILQGALRGIKVDVIDYSQYPWIDAAVVEDGITLASPRDIAAMKINAIEGRGTRKDFIDIYFLLQEVEVFTHTVFQHFLLLTLRAGVEAQVYLFLGVDGRGSNVVAV